MSKAISRPSYFDFVVELTFEVVKAYGILVNNIVKVAYCLVVFDPSSIGNLKLIVGQQALNFKLMLMIEIFIPILKEHYFGDEILSGCILRESQEHRVKDSFRVPLVHFVEKGGGSEVDVFELSV